MGKRPHKEITADSQKGSYSIQSRGRGFVGAAYVPQGQSRRD